MSYNPNPDWADVELVNVFEKTICPHCKQVGYIDSSFQHIYEPSYYNPRHIPPRLIFMCTTEECEYYEHEFQLNITIRVYAQGEVSDYVC